MRYKSRFSVLLLAVAVGVMFVVPQVQAATPVGKISSFSGEVIILSKAKVYKVTQVGQVLNAGDKVQTKDGEAQITFIDGALMKVRPYTTTMVQEREEETGFWPFKAKKAVRRITCFVGKLWFKSGASDRQNFLQSPTAVAGLRGSDGDFGFNPANLETYLNMYTGDAAVVGSVIRGLFSDLGPQAAAQSPVFNQLAAAYESYQQAQESGDPVAQAQAQADAYQVVKQAAGELQKNPDGTVKEDAQLADAAADAGIAAAEAEVVVETVKQTQQQAEASGDSAAAEKAAAALAAAEAAAAQAASAAEAANAAADARNLAQARESAQEAKEASQQTKTTAAQAGITTTVATSAATTTAATTTAATTSAATTSILTTTSTTSTTSSIETTASP